MEGGSSDTDYKKPQILNEDDLKRYVRDYQAAEEAGDMRAQILAMEGMDKFIDISDFARFFRGHVGIIVEEEQERLSSDLKLYLEGLKALMEDATGGVAFGRLVGSGMETLELYLKKLKLLESDKPMPSGTYSADDIYNHLIFCITDHTNIKKLNKLFIMMLTFRKKPKLSSLIKL